MAHFVTDIPDHEITINEDGARHYLAQHGFTEGMIKGFLRNAMQVPIRFFICDDSGSMYENDGKRLIKNKTRGLVSVPCSRWDELKDSLEFHMGLADASNSLTEFRFLNGPPSLVIGDFERDPDRCGLREMKKVLAKGPHGGTPLCAHINAIIPQIRSAERRLREAGQVACIVICTDGQCSDGNLVQAMKPLEHLPCWVVVKLCTDDDAIVNYWNNVDNQLELEMDVLDDLESEAKEVTEHNPWLNYSLQMHRIREWGFKHLKELDLLDERSLTHLQLVNVLCLLFDKEIQDFPHPQADAHEFKRAIKACLPTVKTTYDPLYKRVMPVIHYYPLKSKYNLPGITGCSMS